MKGEVLKEKLKRTGVSFASIARKLNTHPQSLTSIFKGPDVKSGFIEKMAAVLNLPISYFYEDFDGEENPNIPFELGITEYNIQHNKSSNGEKIKFLTQEIEFLKEKIEQKDLIIKEKDKVIELYDYLLKDKIKGSSI